MAKHILIFLMFMFAVTSNAAVSTGMLAPDFKLQDQNGNWHSIANYRGKWVILYFYPKDETPGCTIEARNFRDAMQTISALNASVLGVSLDDVESHKDFAKTENLNFSLLADVKHQAAKAYGVLTKLGPIQYTKRETFIIDPAGNIVKHYQSVKPENHAHQVIEDLKQLQKTLEN